MANRDPSELNTSAASSDTSLNSSMKSDASSTGAPAPNVEKGPFESFKAKTTLFGEVFYKSDQNEKLTELEKANPGKRVHPEEGMFHVFSSLGRPFLLMIFEYCFVFLIGFFTGMGLSLIIITNLFGFNFNRCRYGGGTGADSNQMRHLSKVGGVSISSEQAKTAAKAAGIKLDQHSRIVLSQFVCPRCPGSNSTKQTNVTSIASYVYYEPVDSESNYKCLAMVFVIMISILCLFILFGMFKLFRMCYHKHVDKMHKLLKVEKKDTNLDQEPEKSYSYSVSRKSLSGVET